MNNAMKMAAAFFTAQKIKFDADEQRNVIRTGFNAHNKDHVEVLLIFDGDTTMGLRSFNYVKFPEEKKAAMYQLCSEMNKQYRWVKFYVDEQDNTITLSDDAVIQVETAGEESFELMMRLIGIADQAYPTFMKALWA